jgi:short-subunit dehydrogenase
LRLTRIAVITGASSGIGEALARALAERDWHCVLLARREDRLRTLAAELGAEYEICDVGDRSAVERAAAAIGARHPSVQLLVNNAGISARVGFLEIEPDQLEAVMRVNYFGSVWALRAFLPLLERSDSADVVNIVSVAGTVSSGRSGPYGGSKHAQLAFSRAVTAELGTRGISVHTINPGLVETEGFPQRAVLERPLVRRLVIEPEDVARHVIRVLERGRRETFVPGWYRVAGLMQVLVPGLVARVARRR